MDPAKQPPDWQNVKWHAPPEEPIGPWTKAASYVSLVILAGLAGSGGALGLHYYITRPPAYVTDDWTVQERDAFYARQIHGASLRVLLGSAIGVAGAVGYLVYSRYQEQQEAERKRQLAQMEKAPTGRSESR